MSIELTTDQVWDVIEDDLFCVLGMANKRSQARTVGWSTSSRTINCELAPGLKPGRRATSRYAG